jgi:hypothetical protein
MRRDTIGERARRLSRADEVLRRADGQILHQNNRAVSRAPISYPDGALTGEERVARLRAMVRRMAG